MIVGRALATTVLSMVIMNALTATTASAHLYRPRVNAPARRIPPAPRAPPDGRGEKAASPYERVWLL
ncbi:hypothetical protein Arub01_27060 [Actinomadura rubrobrunea]|uniref:Uncharacterized protein n=1 Tax=Actinomadura rubrobrunea TaxID=115335 RepID=A0A9W6PVL1_9ACTN|nr:hypothetical protein Arub01_27060 [Actinomadura rubrobrunea]